MWLVTHVFVNLVDDGHRLLFFCEKKSVSVRRFFDALCEYLVYSVRRMNRVVIRTNPVLRTDLWVIRNRIKSRSRATFRV